MSSDQDENNKYDVEPGGFQKMVGYDITEWDVGHAVLSLDAGSDHGNRNGFIHGGVLMTMLDAACTRAGAVCPNTGELRRSATVSMTTNFIRAAQGGVLRVEGKKTGGGQRLFFAEASAFDDDGHLLATAMATCRYASGSS